MRRFGLSLRDRIAGIGVDPDDSEDERLKKTVNNVGWAVVSAMFMFFVAPLYVFFHEPWAGLNYFVFAVLVALQLVLIGLRRMNHDQMASVMAFVALPAHLLGVVLLGGFANSGGLPLWGLVFPVLVFVIFYGTRRATRWFVLFLANLVLSLALQPWLRPTNNLPPLVNALVLAGNLILITGFIFFILVYFIGQRDLAHRLLRGEQTKSENLLLNILPREIAAILKNEARTIADHYDGATILFADVVNFTPMSAQMSATALVELLNEVFSHFDTLAEKYEVEKIKTIGDCYMVAAGVPRPRPDHAHRLVRLALEMRDYVAATDIQGRRLAFRIGINSGPVVAGVIGRKKFIYDLWGDAVNTASRMESHGAGGLIQITRSTYELVQGKFACEPRGTINVKGKGPMEVWSVVGALETAPRAPE